MTDRLTDPPPLDEVLLGFVDEIDRDVERWSLDRAYMVAGGAFLAAASRLGWPAADRALSYVLAVRRLANLNALAPERRDRDRAEAHYRQQRDEIRDSLEWHRTHPT